MILNRANATVLTSCGGTSKEMVRRSVLTRVSMHGMMKNIPANQTKHNLLQTVSKELFNSLTHICVGNLTIIGSDNGLSPARHQAIIWTNAGISTIGPKGTNCNEILIEIHTFSFKKMHLKMSSAKWRPFCLGPNVLTGRFSMILAGMCPSVTAKPKCNHFDEIFVHLTTSGAATNENSIKIVTFSFQRTQWKCSNDALRTQMISFHFNRD